jgi:predicted DNA-binding transcriptional regulator YafY
VKFTTDYQYELSEKQLPLDAKIQLIDKAIDNNSSLEITYLKPKDEKSRRIIKPESVGEMEYKGKKYIGVWAYCLERQDYRSFRVDRILKVKEIASEETSIVE